MKFNLRLLYLYLFSFVGLIITVIGSISILDLTLKTYVFRVENRIYYEEPVIEGQKPLYSRQEQEEMLQAETSNQNKRQLSNSLAMILVGAPLYLYHWQTIKKEDKKS